MAPSEKDESLREAVIQWLLAQGEPWVRYRTLVDLLGLPEDDAEVRRSRREMMAHPRIRALVEELSTWPGYPLKRHNDARHPLHKLAVLADFGLREDDPGLAGAFRLVLAHQSPEGAFQSLLYIPKAFGGTDTAQWAYLHCDAPSIVYALQRAGFGEQPTVRRAIAHLVAAARENGWPCQAGAELGRFRGPGRKEDPCPYATLIALKALATVPSMHDSAPAQVGIEMLLRHWAERPRWRPYLFGVGREFVKIKYPYVWYDVLHVVEVLSQFPAARDDPRLREMATVIRDKADADGRYTPESVWMAWKEWDFGQKKRPSPWLTLLVWRLLER